MMPSPLRPGDVVAGKYRIESTRVLRAGRDGRGAPAARAPPPRRARRRQVPPRLRLCGRAEASLARFVREGRAAMRIRSEYVVRVPATSGTLVTGETYMVLEYLEGRNLAAILDQDRAAATTGRGGARVRASGHRGHCARRTRGGSSTATSSLPEPLPHPARRRYAAGEGARLRDRQERRFRTGGAPRRSPLAASSRHATGYMAPEQLRSAATPVDARTDVWTLGVCALFHVLLTGALPFAAGSAVEMHERILRGGRRCCERRAPGAPAALEAIVLAPVHAAGSRRIATRTSPS